MTAANTRRTTEVTDANNSVRKHVCVIERFNEKQSKMSLGQHEHGKRVSWVRSYGYGTNEMLPCTRSWLFSCISSGPKFSPSIVSLDSFCISISAVHSSTCVEMNYIGIMFQTEQCVTLLFSKFNVNIIHCFIRPDENPGIKIIEHFLALSKFGPEIT